MARPYPTTINTTPTGKLTVKKIKNGYYSVSFTAPEEILEDYDEEQLVNPLTREILRIDTIAKKLTIFPYSVRGREPMGNRYKLLESITLDIYIPDGEVIAVDDVRDILETELPKVFVKDYTYGLGFRQDYRFIVEDLELMFIKHINIVRTGKSQFRREEETVNLKLSDLSAIAKRIDQVTNRARRITSEVKSGATAALLMDILSKDKRREKLSEDLEKIAAVLTEEIGAPPYKSPQKKAADAIETIERNAEYLVKETPDVLFKLKNDIEAVTLKELIVRFENMLVRNLSESRWQTLLQENPFILNMAFGTPIMKIQGQAFVGGRKLEGKGEKIADFLFANSISQNATIIEIKKPSSPLIRDKPYRKNVYAPSGELVAGVNQVLDQIYQLQRNIAHHRENSRMNNLETYYVNGILVIGKIELNEDQIKAFELYRGNSKNIQIVTFGELLQKLKQLAEFLNVKLPQPPKARTFDEDSDEVPF